MKKRKSGKSPTQRTLKLMEERGYHSNIVEKTIPYTFIKVDLFNWVDIVSVQMNGHGVMGIQVTSGDNFAARLKKARGNEALMAWLTSGGRLVLHGWRKLDGKWEVREYELTPNDVRVEAAV